MADQAHPDLLALDEMHRRLAIDPTQSFIVEAPAGAGKTELLTQRFLALLSRVNDPEEVVALTFTRRAAAEMRERITTSLARAAQGPAPDEAHRQITHQLSLQVLVRNREREWNLLDHPDRLQVTTLDSLCARLARQMPLLSRFGGQPGVLADASPLYQRAVSAVMEELEKEGEVADALVRVLPHFDNSIPKLQVLLESMLDRREQWLGHAHRTATEWDRSSMQVMLSKLLEQKLKTTANAMCQELRQRLTQVVLCGHEHLRLWPFPLDTRSESLPYWKELAHLLLTQEGKIRTRLPNHLSLGENELGVLRAALVECRQILEANSLFAELLAEINQLPMPEYPEDEWQLIQDLVTILRRATAQLWLVFQEEGQVDFSQISQNALMALGEPNDPTDLALHLDYRISHLLVDEFQDTSPVQATLLERLTSGWQPEDGRTLFLVGDPMQSIYRFRKADVGLFLKVRDGGLGQIQPKGLTLYRNNRSCESVVRWINDTFPPIFENHEDPQSGAVRFVPARATKSNVPGAGVFIHPLVVGAGEEADELEARTVVALIREIRERSPGGSLAILVRARKHVESLARELRSHHPDLPYQAVEIDPLGERQVVADLVTLTRALHHTGDRLHWLALLRAPWCGLRLADLHALAADAPSTPLWTLMQDEDRLQQLTPDGQQRLRHVRVVLNDALLYRAQQRPRRWIEGVWQALGGPCCLSHPGDLTDAHAFFSVLDRLENRGLLDLSRLDAEVGKLYATTDPSAANTLQIMTIHKSKGLEFDAVILPVLHRASRSDEKPLLLWDQILGPEGSEHLVVAAKTKAHQEKHDFLTAFEKSREQHESRRVLYVAATRGIRELHLVGVANRDPNTAGALKTPLSGSFLEMLWSGASAEFGKVAAQELTSITEHGTRDPKSHSWQFDGRLVRLVRPEEPEALRATPMNKPDPDPFSPPGCSSPLSRETVVGTLVHRYFEIMAKDGASCWPRSRIITLAEPVRRWLKVRGLPESECDISVSEVLQALENAAGSPVGHWVLKHRDEERNEWCLNQTDGKEISSLRMDRTFVENGIRWIIDYKVVRLAETQDMETLLRENAEGHHAQLARYAALFPDETVIKAIYYPLQNRLLVLGDDAAPDLTDDITSSKPQAV